MNTAVPQQNIDTSILKGVKVLLQGPTGTGKTFIQGTLIDTGLEVFYLGIDSGTEALIGYYRDKGKEPPPNLHIHQMATADWSLESMIAAANNTLNMTYEMLTKQVDPYKSQYNQYVNLLKVLTDFPDDRTGEKFGPVDKWGTDRVLIIDALTGINTCVMSMVVGTKPVVSPGEWQVGMQHVEKFLKKLVDIRCHFILLAHIERELDEVEGGTKITVSTLGRKLAPKISPMFGDVILSVRQGTKWSWSTAHTQADLKTRNLPVQEGIPPNMATIIQKWESRGGKRK